MATLVTKVHQVEWWGAGEKLRREWEVMELKRALCFLKIGIWAWLSAHDRGPGEEEEEKSSLMEYRSPEEKNLEDLEARSATLP